MLLDLHADFSGGRSGGLAFPSLLKLYKALDKLEAVIQHNESPLDTWEENEYELNKTYAFDAVAFSEWLTDLRKAVLDDTLEKIANEGR